MSAGQTGGSEPDPQGSSAGTMADELLQKACMAAAVFQQYDQEQTDRIVERVCRAGFDQRVALAKMACAETGLGVWEHKVIKRCGSKAKSHSPWKYYFGWPWRGLKSLESDHAKNAEVPVDHLRLHLLPH